MSKKYEHKKTAYDLLVRLGQSKFSDIHAQSSVGKDSLRIHLDLLVKDGLVTKHKEKVQGIIQPIWIYTPIVNPGYRPFPRAHNLVMRPYQLTK